MRQGRTLTPTRLYAGCLFLAMGAAQGGVALGAMVGGSGVANVRVSHDAYAAHAQPALAVDARNGRDLLGAAMAMGAGTLVEETFVSRDGGRAWHDNGALPLPVGLSFGGDPSVAIDAHGTGYVTSLGESQDGDGVYLWRAEHGGFGAPVVVERGWPADHPWLAADPSPGQGATTLYVAWATRDVAGLGHAGGLAFSRSTDGGRRFAAPRIVSAPAGGVSIPALAAGPDGAVYIAYATLHSRGGPSIAGQPAATDSEEIQVVGSRNHGASFSPPTVAGRATTLLAAAPGVNLTTQPSIAVDGHDGSVYVAYSAYRAGTRRADVVLVHSRDSGRTWSAPVSVSSTLPRAALAFQPRVVVDESGGVDVTFFVLARGRVDLVLARSTTHSARSGPLRRITSRSFDPTLGWSGQKTGTWWIGDYQGLAAAGGMLHPFWNDTRTGRLEIYTAAIPTSGDKEKGPYDEPAR